MRKMKMLSLLSVMALAGALTLSGCSTSASSSNQVSRGADSSGYTEMTNGTATDAVSDTSSDDASVEVSETTETKHIYSGSLLLDTTKFDDTVDAVRSAVPDGGYIETSQVFGTDGKRSAHFELRVPENTFEATCEALRGLDATAVVDDRVSAEDVTESTLTLQSELSVAQSKLDALRELYTTASNLDERLAMLDRISEQERTVATIQDAIDFYDDATTYSRLVVDIDEVDTIVTDDGHDFGDQAVSALQSGWTGFVTGAQELVLLMLAAWPVLVFAGVIVGAIVVTTRREKRGKKPAAPAKNTEGNTQTPEGAEPKA